MSDHLAPYREHPFFDRATVEVHYILPPVCLPLEKDDVRTLMILAWLRGVAWQSQDTN